MLFSLILLVLTLAAFFAIKAKTFDHLAKWGQMTIVGLASLILSSILTMLFFISVRRTIIAFLEAIQGIPVLVVGGVLLVLLVLIFPLLRLLGRMDMDKLKQFWQQEVAPRRRTFVKSALDLGRTFAWDRTRSLFDKVRSYGNRRRPEEPVPPDDRQDPLP